ncbi:hypothetical protein NX059_000968 [Plenodomus lindquistii]|nr:hypothetical protein NX059_000968 [Plenodomus lindquistii]
MTTMRDPTVILRDHTDYTTWMTRLKARCIAHNIWDKINPKSTTRPTVKPVAERAPVIADYAPANASNTSPRRITDLSTAGQKAFRDDLEYHKILLEQYKNDRHDYEKEQSSLQHIVAFIQSTVTPHLLRTCCLPDQSLRKWLISLEATIGIDEQLEQERARERYLQALKPMRTSAHWDSWLAEYDQAATEAEAYNVPEVLQINAVTKDFLTSVNKVANVWATTFQDSGRYQPGMNRKEMMKRYREYMMNNHPLKTGKSKASFIAAHDEASHDTAEGEAHQDSTRDASTVNSAPSRRGRPRNQRGNDRKRQAERPPEGSYSSTKCLACGQRHALKDCYYLHEEKAPGWWKPNESVKELVKFKKEPDPELQGLIRSQSRPRTRTPTIKQSHTPTPEIE